ncbi:hypothetical protein TorRG33x02_164150 [Trema orientale]|uniref:Uncharacterized protein n=1 Tax=Trema orientale TaxID=63057 RepID=A0A2P5EQ87_TREOI|nr:hypothetical protein TorRG33x02_164150 [Trema orientale]
MATSPPAYEVVAVPLATVRAVWIEKKIHEHLALSRPFLAKSMLWVLTSSKSTLPKPALAYRSP